MKLLLIGIGLIFILTIGFFALNSYIYTEKQGDATGTPPPYRATIQGTLVCLKSNDTSGASAAVCRQGIETAAKEYYAIDFSRMSEMPSDIQNGTVFNASGVVTPIEYLSAEEWRSYDVSGIFSVTDSVNIVSQHTVVPPRPPVVVDPDPVTPTPIATSTEPAASCFVGGCSSQLCTDDPNVVSTCEWREAYACYQGATCERQASGECGWTETAELLACIDTANDTNAQEL